MLPASLGAAAAGTRWASSFPAPEATLLRWGQERLGQAVDPCHSVLAMGTGWDSSESMCCSEPSRFPEMLRSPPMDSSPPLTGAGHRGFLGVRVLFWALPSLALQTRQFQGA